jgi:hypothetical protein
VVQFCGLPRLVLEKQRLITDKTKAHQSLVFQMVHSDLCHGSIFPVTLSSVNHIITTYTARITQQGATRIHHRKNISYAVCAGARDSIVGRGTKIFTSLEVAGSNPEEVPGRRGGKPATNRLSYGAASSPNYTCVCCSSRLRHMLFCCNLHRFVCKNKLHISLLVSTQIHTNTCRI